MIQPGPLPSSSSTTSSSASSSAVIVATYYNYYYHRRQDGEGRGPSGDLKGCTMRFKMDYGSAFGVEGVNKGVCPEDMQKLQLEPQLQGSSSATSSSLSYERGSGSRAGPVACIACDTGHIAEAGGVCRSCYDSKVSPKGVVGAGLQARCTSGYDVPS
jgi:hypothetical protein